ncbi:MAG: NAD-dependent aldehyde dehydrogenase [halophilic archaeon J07HX5]|nr:MAG: NAD-dependent aldehyde dehydrogenase [halophilic archaeon J07HX5]
MSKLSVTANPSEQVADDLTIAPITGWNAQYIDGEWIPAGDRETIAVEEPSSGAEIGRIPVGTADDVDTAYQAAARAQSDWETTTAHERAAVINDAREIIRGWEDELIYLFAAESGSVNAKARSELNSLDAIMEVSEGLASQVSGEYRTSPVENKETQVRQKPVGVVGVITPWNFPFHLSMRVVAPALAAGNAVVLKPDEQTPYLGGHVIARAFEEAGLPAGLLNVVTGDGAQTGDAVVTHETPRMISFTGSSEVGRKVGARAVEQFAYPELELGGNNVHIVTENADLDWAVDSGVFGSFTHQGQICISINRHIVHESVYDEYVERLSDRAAALPIGDPHEPDTVVGPIINEQQRDKIVEFIAQSQERGAVVETGGGHDELFVEPTVLSNVNQEMPVACNEHFGPVAPVIPYETESEALAIANDTRYGLSGSVHSTDLSQAKRIATELETGMVHINDQPVNDDPNTPFGGVGASGLGRYNGEAILDRLTETKWISIQNEPRDYPY